MVFKLYDYVEYNRNGIIYTGFIDQIAVGANDVKVVFFKRDKEDKYPIDFYVRKIVDIENLKVLPNEMPVQEDCKILIDIALDMKDKEMFMHYSTALKIRQDYDNNRKLKGETYPFDV